MPQRIDWTIGTAPDSAEPLLAPPPVPSRPKAARRVGWVIGLLSLGSLLALGGYSLWNGFQVRRAVQQVIASEELAGRSGDVAALWNIADPSDWDWRKTLIGLAVNHQAAPLPAAVLQQMPDAPEVISFTVLAHDDVRADVTRSYRAPDGAVLAFTLPQFYHYTQGQWNRLAPPAEWTKPFLRDGAHATILYDTVDAGFVEGDLAPYLDDVLGRACVAWGCPPDTKIRLQLGSGPSLPISPDQLSPPGDEPLLFAFARSKDLTITSNVLILPAPHLAGYPANPPAAAWLKRAIALQALSELATRLTVPDAASPSTNAFLYALVARTAARLGLESSQSVDSATPNAAVQISLTTLSSNVNVMWDMNLDDAFGQPVLGLRDAAGNVVQVNDPAGRDVVLHSALAITNRLLRGQPAGTEFKLLGALKSAHNQTSWLSQGLGVTPDEAWTRLQLAVWNTRQVPHELQFALTCSVSVVLASPSKTVPVFANYQFGYESVLSYSPKGQYLLVDSNGESVVIDLDTGAFTHLPWLDPRLPGLFRGWLSNTVLATLQETSPSATLLSLHFIDVTDPQHELPSVVKMANIADYNLSPDKTQAAVIFAPDPQTSRRFTLAIMPAWGGILKPIDETIPPDRGSDSIIAWSPDSQALGYLHLDPTGGRFSLRVADTSTGLSHEIWTSHDPVSAAGVYGFIAWAPLGHQIAFALQNAQPPDSPAAWLGMVNADGSGLKLLRQQNAVYTKLGFSADGQYLAATYYNSRWDSSYAGTIVVYAAADGSQIQGLVYKRDHAWSGSGHQLAVADSNGVKLIADIGQPEGQILAGEFCGNIIADPAP